MSSSCMSSLMSSLIIPFTDTRILVQKYSSTLPTVPLYLSTLLSKRYTRIYNRIIDYKRAPRASRVVSMEYRYCVRHHLDRRFIAVLPSYHTVTRSESDGRYAATYIYIILTYWLTYFILFYFEPNKQYMNTTTIQQPKKELKEARPTEVVTNATTGHALPCMPRRVSHSLLSSVVCCFCSLSATLCVVELCLRSPSRPCITVSPTQAVGTKGGTALI